MENLKKIGKFIARILLLFFIVVAILILIYWLLPVRKNFNNSKYDKKQNAIWIGHGFLGDDLWFSQNNRNINDFRNPEKLNKLFAQFEENHIKFIFPHICPTTYNGEIAKYNFEQVELVLDIAEKFNIKVIPWVGGVFNESARINDENWRQNFINSIDELLKKHPRITGIQINIEPLPSGNQKFLSLLENIKSVIGDKILSVAAYPPPTFLHPFPNVHWELDYINKVAMRSDQMAVMMYDTAIRLDKFYILLMRKWSNELNETVKGTSCKLLLGVPAYEDSGVGYHYPSVENLENALSGIEGSNSTTNYQGISIYCEWEMDSNKWKIWNKFLKKQTL